MPSDRKLPALLPPMEPTPERASRESATKRNRKAAGRFAVLNAFVDHGARMVNTTAVAVWLVIYREVQTDGLATISHARIAERLNVSRLTVTRALRRLIAAGFVTVIRHGGWQRGPSTYQIRGSIKPRAP
jgi:hypothetical protein